MTQHVRNPQPGPLAVISFGLAVGLTWALAVFLLGIDAGLFDWGVTVVAVLSSLYIGYEPTFVGSVAGTVWAFADGFIGGVIIAWLYNRLLLRRARAAPAAEPEETPAAESG